MTEKWFHVLPTVFSSLVYLFIGHRFLFKLARSQICPLSAH